MNNINISCNSPAFQSKIKFIDNRTFQRKTNCLDFLYHEVLYPWTIETMKIGETLYTTGIVECLGCVFTDGKKSALAHLATRDCKIAEGDRVKPFDIANIEKVLMSKYNLQRENIHAIILGAWDSNIQYLEELIKLIEKYKMPYSVLADRKDVLRYGKFSMLFNTKQDTLYISNSLTDARNYNKCGIINEYEIDVHKDGIEYNTYVKGHDMRGEVKYDKIRKKTGPKEFFESQFKRVSLCKLDEWA